MFWLVAHSGVDLMRRQPLLLLVLTAVQACALTTTAGPGDTPPPPPVSAADGPFQGCAPAHTHGAVLAWAQGGDLMALDADGQARVLDPGGPDEALLELATDGEGRIALHRQRREGTTTTHVTYRLRGPDGAPAWTRTQTVVAAGSPLRTTRTLQRLVMGDGGAVFAQHAHWDGARRSALEWIGPDGVSVWREGVEMLQTLGAGRAALVQRIVDGAPSLERWEPATDRVSPFGPPPGATLHRFALGARTVEMRAVEGVVTLVVVDGPTAPALTLPFATLAELSVDAMHPAGRLLLSRRDAPDAALQVDLNAGRVTEFPLRFAAGMRRISAGAQPALDGDGAVLMLLRDDRVGRLFRSVDGQTWIPLGRALVGPLGAELRVEGDTALVYAHSMFFGGESWPEAGSDGPDTLQGTSLQVVRRGGAHGLVLTADDPDLAGLSLAPEFSAGGGCVAWATSRQEGAAVEVLNLLNGARRRFAAPTRTLRTLRWL